MSNIQSDKINGLELFRSLIKDGCEWQGDVCSNKWSECLYLINEHARDAVKRTLRAYNEGTDFELEGNIDAETFESVGIWII